MISYEFEFRFPNRNITKALEYINEYFNLTSDNLIQSLNEINTYYRVSNGSLMFNVCSKNFDLVMRGKYYGDLERQEEIFKVLSPFIRDYEIYVYMVMDDVIIMKWCNENGIFYTQDHRLDNYYEEDEKDIPNLEDDELLASFESYGIPFEDVLNLMQKCDEKDLDEKTSDETESDEEKECDVNYNDETETESDEEQEFDSDDELEFENIEDAIEYYVHTNPYPSFTEMDDILSNKLELWSEYSAFNHEICEMIYKNITNKDIVRECARKIFIRGGKQGLISNLFIIQNFSPISKSLKSRIRNYPRILNEHLTEIIDWCGNN